MSLYFEKYLFYKKLYLEKKNNQVGGSSIFPNMIPFKPEITPKEIEVDNILDYFPPTDKADKLQISNIGKYSIIKPDVAELVSQLIISYFPKSYKKLVITDACGNMGGATINFAYHFATIQTVEIVPIHCNMLKNNINQYPYAKKKTRVFCADYMNLIDQLEQDVVFFDPPWGGTDYKDNKHLNLFLNQVNMADIINYLLDRTKLVIMRVPRNFNFATFLKKMHTSEINIHKEFFDKSKYTNFYVISVKGNLAKL